MAITRAQQFKQMLAQGGRIGLQGGGADMGGVADSAGNVGASFGGGDDGDRRENRISNQYGQPMTVAQIGTLSDPREKKDDPISIKQPKGLGNLALSILSGATDLPFALFNKIRSSDLSGPPQFAGLKEMDFGPANPKFLFPRMAQGPRTMGTMPTEEEEETPFRLAPRFRAEGGSMNDEVVGGEMDFESARQMYGLGKLVKKVTRSVKKIAKSPVGKAAIAAALFKMSGGLKETGFLKSKALPFLVGTAGGAGYSQPGMGIFRPETKGILGVGGKFSPFKTILAASGIAGLMSGQEEEDETVSPEQLGPKLNIPEYRRDPFGNLAIRFRAEGGSTEAKEPVAKKTMPLLDMGGMEKDYREDGGFVPIGRMEKADDVPARLSKNEFVFTADAVRNAGDGNVDKGAEVMYNMMKNLEAGGKVSEESQGLEGARRMFQTSQRLEEVL